MDMNNTFGLESLDQREVRDGLMDEEGPVRSFGHFQWPPAKVQTFFPRAMAFD